nr:hypothetical protein [Tanacetum cinerariifolium]
MSSLNNPTFDIKDAFSSNYTPALRDYSPASPGNTPSESSNNSYGLVPIESPTLLLFHDDPYMKVMHAYDTIMLPQVPIPLPIIILILCCLVNVDEMAPKRTSKSAAPAMTQAAIQQLVTDSVDAALEVQAANMENADNTNRNSEPREAHIRTESVFFRSNCTEDYKVKFATGTLTEEALFWWNSFALPIGIEEAYKFTWVEYKKLLIKKYCPRTEELETLCPTMVSDSEKMMEAFIEGLP